jgi:ribose transport system permease protein
MNGATLLGAVRRHSWVPPLVVLLLLLTGIGILRPSTFGPDQINIKVAAAMTLILIATGETIVVMRGGIDLSVGGILSLATAIASTRPEGGPLEAILWIGFALLVGVCVGVINGLLITVIRLQPFVVTLATWSIAEGTALVVLPSESSGVPDSWVAAGAVMPFGFSMPLILLGLLLLWWAWFRRTRAFNSIRAAGSNERSAYLNRVSILSSNAAAYGLAGFFAAAAGIYFSVQTGAGSPTLGVQYVLPAIAAVVIGGSSLMGGRASLVGTVVGAFILTLIGDLVFLLKLQSYWQPVMSGAILMLVVILAALTESRSQAGGSS